MQRRGRATPKLQVCAFQAAGAGTAPSTFISSSSSSSSSRPAEPATSYDVLEIPPTATDREIKAAYRRLAGQYHPDRTPPAEKEASTTKFLQIHAAYSLLSDPRRRAQYDLQLSLTAFQATGYKSRLPRSARAYPASSPSSNYCSPRSPFSTGRGRSWETDQCWC
ncbi:hypothetical protein L7F22_008832 [Adiantum nelumboides]|nr:hypothetical protein [Adiantum nelumboides]